MNINQNYKDTTILSLYPITLSLHLFCPDCNHLLLLHGHLVVYVFSLDFPPFPCPTYASMSILICWEERRDKHIISHMQSYALLFIIYLVPFIQIFVATSRSSILSPLQTIQTDYHTTIQSPTNIPNSTLHVLPLQSNQHSLKNHQVE